MGIIQWNDSYDTGNQTLDAQHQKFVAVVNAMETNEHLNVDSEVISEILTFLREFTENHFEAEESYMEQIGYPDLQEHRKQHRHFRIMAGKFCMDAIAHDVTLPARLKNFLSCWWTDHILQIDMDLKLFSSAQSTTAVS